MYKIAVCDDEAAEVKNISDIIEQVMPEGIVEVSQYTNGKYLLNDIGDNKYFDIIMLDICMGNNIDGVTVAKKIREKGVCSGSILFFITSYEADVATIVDLNPMAYIYKPAQKDHIKAKLQKAIDVLKMNGRAIEFVSDRQNQRVRLDEIMYIESYSRGVIIYTRDAAYKTATYKINGIEEVIQSMDFIRCHYSYIVNQNYVRRMAAEEITMYNDKKIPASRKYRDNMFAGLRK